METRFYKGISLRQTSSEPSESVHDVYDYSKKVERNNSSLASTKYIWHTSTQRSCSECLCSTPILMSREKKYTHIANMQLQSFED